MLGEDDEAHPVEEPQEKKVQPPTNMLNSLFGNNAKFYEEEDEEFDYEAEVREGEMGSDTEVEVKETANDEDKDDSE
jgi:hypothetical protein